MAIRFFVDANVSRPFVAAEIDIDTYNAYDFNGVGYPMYRLVTKGRTFAKKLGMILGYKYTVDGYKHGVYIARERGIFEIVNEKEYDITNRIMETPLKDVWLGKVKTTEVGWTRIADYKFTVCNSCNGNYSFIF